MIIDALLQFDSAAQLAQVVGTYLSTNVIDLGEISGIPSSANGGGARDIGVGDDPAIKVLALVTTAFASAGAATLAVSLQGAPDNGSGAPGTWYTFVTSPVFALATLVQGAYLLNIDMPRPPAGVPMPRFLRMSYAIAGATTTAGQVQSELVLDRFDQPMSSAGVLSGYPAGITVSN